MDILSRLPSSPFVLRSRLGTARWKGCIKSIFVFLTLSLLITSSFAKQYSPIQSIPVPVKIIHSYQQVPYFSGIEAGDNFKILVASGSAKAGIEIICREDVMPKVMVGSDGGRLVLRLERPDLIPPPHRLVIVKVSRATNLSTINVWENAQVIVRGARSQGLSIYARDWAKVTIQGEVNLRRIVTCSNRNIVVNQTHSRHLIIAASGRGTVSVNGTAHVLSARLWGKSCLEAQHLRTQQVYIDSYGESIGKVWPIFALYAFAADHGNIYYYHKPTVLMRQTHQSGNVLQVANKS